MINLLILVVLGGVGAFIIWFGRLYVKAAEALKQSNEQLDAQGVTTEAEIVNHRTVSGKNSIRYYITFQYVATLPDGKTETHTAEEAIHGNDYRKLNLGDHIKVRYLPGTPKTVRIESGARIVFSAQTMQVSGTIMMILGIVTAVAGVFLFFGVSASEGNRAATSTAYTLQRSATPNKTQIAATIQAATATMTTDLATVSTIREALLLRIADWKKVTDRVMHRVYPPETGLDLGEIEIDYGYCESGAFYTYVWLKITDRLNLGYLINTFFDGYGYVEESTPANCYPKELAQVWLRNAGSLGNSWFAVSGATEVRIEKNK